VIDITPSFGSALEEAMGYAHREHGSVTGWLEQINLHSGQNVFSVYPMVGPRRVRCLFGVELREVAVGSVDQYVTVYGELEYRAHSQHPHSINAERIEAHGAGHTAVTLDELRGIAPDATGEESSEEFVRRVRDAWS